MAQILLLGGDADSNVGDTAILLSLGQCIARALPHVRLSVTSNQALRLGEFAGLGYLPRDTAVLPKGLPGFASLLTTARRQDLIIVAGGGLFQDDDSRIKMPYWAARIALLKSFNPRIAGLAVGAGPLRHPESRAAARLACAALSRISVRDRFARDALAACTSKPVEIVPDPAFMLEPASQEEAREHLRRLGFREGKPLIAATIRRWYHERGGFIPNSVRFGLGLELKRDHARFEGMLGVVSRSLE